MIPAEKAGLTKILALLPRPLIFGRIPKCFDIRVWTFWLLALNRKSNVHAEVFISCFVICCLADS